MRKFVGIVESTIAPPINYIWLKDNILKANINGEWVDITSTGGNIPGGDDDKIVILDLSEEQATAYFRNQLITIENDNLIGGADTIILRIANSTNSTSVHIMNNILRFDNSFVYRGDVSDLTSITDGLTYSNKIMYVEGVLNITSGTFAFKLLSTNIPNDIIGLEIGNSSNVKNHNLAILNKYNLSYFFTQLDYGYGVGTFNSTNGGFIHIINAYGYDVFYQISTDGAISKDDNYIKPNEPYSIQLKESNINTILDDITASKVLKCGEIIIQKSNGIITYSKGSTSSNALLYFSSLRQNGSTETLVYNINSKKLALTVIDPYIAPATINSAGGVKKVAAIEDIAVDSASVESVAYKLNDILAALRTAGLLSI